MFGHMFPHGLPMGAMYPQPLRREEPAARVMTRPSAYEVRPPVRGRRSPSPPNRPRYSRSRSRTPKQGRSPPRAPLPDPRDRAPGPGSFGLQPPCHWDPAPVLRPPTALSESPAPQDVIGALPRRTMSFFEDPSQSHELHTPLETPPRRPPLPRADRTALPDPQAAAAARGVSDSPPPAYGRARASNGAPPALADPAPAPACAFSPVTLTPYARRPSPLRPVPVPDTGAPLPAFRPSAHPRRAATPVLGPLKPLRPHVSDGARGTAKSQIPAEEAAKASESDGSGSGSSSGEGSEATASEEGEEGSRSEPSPPRAPAAHKTAKRKREKLSEAPAAPPALPRSVSLIPVIHLPTRPAAGMPPPRRQVEALRVIEKLCRGLTEEVSLDEQLAFTKERAREAGTPPKDLLFAVDRIWRTLQDRYSTKRGANYVLRPGSMAHKVLAAVEEEMRSLVGPPPPCQTPVPPPQSLPPPNHLASGPLDSMAPPVAAPSGPADSFAPNPLRPIPPPADLPPYGSFSPAYSPQPQPPLPDPHAPGDGPPIKRERQEGNVEVAVPPPSSSAVPPPHAHQWGNADLWR